MSVYLATVKGYTLPFRAAEAFYYFPVFHIYAKKIKKENVDGIFLTFYIFGLKTTQYRLLVVLLSYEITWLYGS